MKSKKVLIVDHIDLNRRLIENLIGQLYSYESVKNGVEAVKRATNEKFDLILMDIHMPIMDGITAAKTIWRKSSYQCPIIAISPISGDLSKKCFLELGFEDLITKPIRPKELLDTIASLLMPSDEEDQSSKAEPVILDKSVIHQLSRFNSLKNIRSLYIDFLEEFDQLMSQLDTAFEEKNQQFLIENLHTIRGNSGSLGANVIFTLSSDADRLARSQDWDSLGIALNKLKNERINFEKYLEEETTFTP
ncbi:response regulator [Algoriphagus sp. D3-2-R+10]|uniref:response regulator n=1 Tax=Algoriphagus aurantiacus TaxID=3103948 RepID=UPI002B3AF832|nr:response regulator [Algoriphagus sp. D3-2-R+10]MEB2776221.1 response regulator [Algoriphagus sp. D3-2-R+10]